jgi:hypothetical protein
MQLRKKPIDPVAALKAFYFSNHKLTPPIGAKKDLLRIQKDGIIIPRN